MALRAAPCRRRRSDRVMSKSHCAAKRLIPRRARRWSETDADTLPLPTSRSSLLLGSKQKSRIRLSVRLFSVSLFPFEFEGSREIQQELSLLAISATVVNPETARCGLVPCKAAGSDSRGAVGRGGPHGDLEGRHAPQLQAPERAHLEPREERVNAVLGLALSFRGSCAARCRAGWRRRARGCRRLRGRWTSARRRARGHAGPWR